mgnify:CR=1 FL=1
MTIKRKIIVSQSMNGFVAHMEFEDGWREPLIHRLDDHLKGVANLSGGFAESFGCRNWGYAAGLIHDIGKFSDEFQEYIHAVVVEKSKNPKYFRGSVDHTSAGAIYAATNKLHILDYLSAGHHSGLQDSKDKQNRLAKTECFESVKERAAQFFSENKIPPLESFMGMPIDKHSLNMLVRLMFSSLVDADYLDTEKFFFTDRLRGGYDSLEVLLQRLQSHLKTLFENSPDTPLNRLRRGIDDACAEAAEKHSGGYFSLSVPTGGGKTLASILWALKFAVKNGKRRVIVAIPYTSIISQTAAQYRKIFGDENVLEHHSNVEPDRIFDANGLPTAARLASENWDAPIVVTTNVQLFESMYANSPSRTRKLHNICKSVIILDEAQMLPPDFLKPILWGLDAFVKIGGASVLFCTATQPVFSGRIGSNKETFESPVKNVREIIPNPDELQEAFRRTKISFLPDAFEIADFADFLRERAGSFLCICNTRAHAAEIYSALGEDSAFHLSRSMCTAHIDDILAKIRASLASGKCTRVVSTQLVEAGVDLDFPEVFREHAGLDSIIQAAGRCNREGRAAVGNVFVFEITTPIKKNRGFISKGACALNETLRCSDHGALDSRENVAKYFDNFFDRCGNFDVPMIGKLLVEGAFCGVFEFETAAQNFRLIDDGGSVEILVPYSDGADLCKRVSVGYSGDSRFFRKLRRYCVSVQKKQFENALASGQIADFNGIYVLVDSSLYSEKIGLTINNKALDDVLMR